MAALTAAALSGPLQHPCSTAPAGPQKGSMSRMAEPQNFLDNLKNLAVVMGVALEFTQKHLDEFMKNCTPNQVRQAERSVTKIRALSSQLEKEFDVLEYLIGKARKSSGETLQ
jgi:hypothetical protein